MIREYLYILLYSSYFIQKFIHTCDLSTVEVIHPLALLTKMSQLGHYETIRTDGNVHWERSSRVNPREIAIIDKVYNKRKVIKIK